jgi:uncharacterized membrane protein HdeD (DUF308 family)
VNAASSMSSVREQEVASATDLWWIWLITGSLWIIFSLLIFQADATSVKAISAVIGIVCIAAALGEILVISAVHGWWRIAHLVLAAAFAVIGILAFIHPQNTFNALATIFAFFLLFRGIFDLIGALLTRGMDLWWVGLIAGTVQILLAFWAAGDFGHKSALLIIWVGATALAHGVMQIIRAFVLRPAS